MKKLTNALLLALMIIVLSSPIPAQATGITRYAKQGGLTDGACDSWANACTLQYALSVAVIGDQIWVAAGTHSPGAAPTDSFTLENGVEIYGGFTEGETDFENRDWETNQTILDGNNTNYHVVDSSDTNSSAVLDGFIIQNGNANSTEPDFYNKDRKGGGIYNLDGSPTLRNLIIRENFAKYDGGGMYSMGGSPSLTNVVFDANVADPDDPALAAIYGLGGGLHNESGSPTLQNVQFLGNFGWRGGAMSNVSGSNPSINNTDFIGNVAESNGGALYNNNHSSPELTNVRFEDNQSGLSGGAIFNSNNSNPIIDKAYFIENIASTASGAYFGGAIYYGQSQSASITNAVFYKNEAGDGGGAVYTTGSTNIQITNATFYANQTRAFGSAPVNGGAIANQSSTLNVKNAILWGNLSEVNSGAPISSQISLVLTGTATVSYSIVQGGWPGTGNLNIDPRFVSASTGDLKLQNTSPAINSGTGISDGCPSDDIEGTARPYGPSCDMGAYEMAVEPLTSTDVTVMIGEDWSQTYTMSFPSSRMEQYTTPIGPVVISSDNEANIIASLLQRRRTTTTGPWTGITQFMGITDAQISNSYVFPRYHSTDPTKYQSIQIATYDNEPAEVTVTIGGVPYGPYDVQPGVNFIFRDTTINAGPVVVSSNGPRIIASLYELQRAGTTGTWTGQTQMLGLPFSQLSDTYIFPRYNNTSPELQATLIFGPP